MCFVRLLIFVCLLAPSIIAQPADRWVSPSGSDWNSATSRNTPWRTITHAMSQLQVADTLIVMDGDYWLDSEPGNINGISGFGNPWSGDRRDGWVGYWTTIRAENYGRATIHGNLQFCGSYIRVEGLRIQGHWGNEHWGILFEDSHHIDINFNEIYDCGGAGIGIGHSDCIRVVGNQVHHNAYRNRGQHSGISIYQPIPWYDPEGRYWRIEIKRNNCYGNFNFNRGDLGITDGNGIILDDFKYTQWWNVKSWHWPMIQSYGSKYPFRTLVESNLCTYNGGSGIHSFSSSGVTIKNNTCIGKPTLILSCHGPLVRKLKQAHLNFVSNETLSNFLWLKAC